MPPPTGRSVKGVTTVKSEKADVEPIILRIGLLAIGHDRLEGEIPHPASFFKV